MKLNTKTALSSLALLSLLASPALAAGIDTDPATTSLPFSIGGSRVMTLTTAGLGIGTTTPQTALDVAGGAKVGATAATCTTALQGTIRFNDSLKSFEGCDGTSWGPLYKPNKLNTVTHTEAICKRGGTFTVISDCPANSTLTACSGGPGDQSEGYEYWVLEPDFANNRCVGYVGQPACYDDGWSRTIVTAVCVTSSS